MDVEGIAPSNGSADVGVQQISVGEAGEPSLPQQPATNGVEDSSSDSNSDTSSSSSSSDDDSDSSSSSSSSASEARGRSLAARKRRLMKGSAQQRRKSKSKASSGKPTSGSLASRYIQDAADESDGEGGVIRGDDDDEDDEDLEGDDSRVVSAGYLADGFVVAGNSDDDDAESSIVSSDSDGSDDSAASGSDSAPSVAPRPRRLRKLQSVGGVRALDEDDLALIAEAAERGEVQVDMDRVAPLAKRMRTSEEPGRDGDDSNDAARKATYAYADEEYDSEGMDEFIERDYAAVEGGEAGAVAGRKRKQRSAPGAARITTGADAEQLSEFDNVFGRGARAVMRARSGEGGAQAGFALADLYDDEEGVEETEVRASRERSQVSNILESAYEPSVLAAHMLRKEDISIRERDEPERLQVLLKARRARRARISAAAGAAVASFAHRVATDGAFNLASEASWIADKLLGSPTLVFVPGYDTPAHVEQLRTESEDSVPAAVQFVLNAIYDEMLDIPFLWMYRKGKLHKDFTLSTLWSIVDLDDLWTRITDRKVAVAMTVDRALKDGLKESDSLAKVADSLRLAASERAVEDVAGYIRTHLTAEAAAAGVHFDTTVKAKGAADPELEALFGSDVTPDANVAVAGLGVRHDIFRIASSSDVRTFFEQVFLRADLLAENLRIGRQLNAVPELASGESVSDMAFACINSDFTSVESVLSAAKRMAATWLAREPYVRASLRRQFFERAEVITSPTDLGERELEATHALFGIHMIRKRLLDFEHMKPLENSRARDPSDAPRPRSNVTIESDGIRAVEDDEHPSISAERAEVAACDSLGFHAGWGSRVGQSRVYETSYRNYARLEARVGGMTQFAVIEQAEQEKLVKVVVEIDDKTVDAMILSVAGLYLSSIGAITLSTVATSVSSETGWEESLSPFDNLRRQAVVEAVVHLLIPEFKVELRAQLRRISHDAISAEYAHLLRRRLAQASYIPPAQPQRARKSEDGDAADKEKEEQAKTQYPWSRPRFRVMAIAFTKRGVADGGADSAAVLDEKGELVDFRGLGGGRDDREAAIAELMFQTSPDTVVVAASGGYRSREVRESVFRASFKCAELVRKARDNFKKRKELIKSYGNAAANHPDKRVAEAWSEAALDARLEPYADRWTVGKWKYCKVRLPFVSERTDRSGRRLVSYDDTDRSATLQVTIVDDEIARVFSMSKRAKQEFPDHTAVVRSAISLGRSFQDPLAEMAYMWARRADVSQPGVVAAANAGVASIPEDLLAVRVHSLQSQIPQHLLFMAAERVMVELVNGTGVDITLAVRHVHLAALLQFVAGLGPRKATSILLAISGLGSKIFTRAEMISRRLVSASIYQNAAGFLRVQPLSKILGTQSTTKRGKRRSRKDESEEDGIFNPFDSTRIHPEDYDLALLLCNASDSKYEALREATPDDPDTYADLVQDLMESAQEKLLRYTGANGFFSWAPGQIIKKDGDQMVESEPEDGLHELSLGELVGVLDKQGRQTTLHVLELIKVELRAPYRDARRPYAMPTPEATFRLVTRETCMTLRPGLVVPARVSFAGSKRLEVDLDNHIKGMIPVENSEVCDDRNVVLSDVYKRGQILMARIVNVDRVKFSVTLQELPNDLAALWNSPPVVDVAFDLYGAMALQASMVKKLAAETAKAALEMDASAAMREMARKNAGVTMRAISHPAFKNILSDEAAAYLRNAGPYTCVFRPSSKNPDHLTLSWKVRDPDGIVHIDITESDKDRLGSTALGRKLTIGSATYADLDEVLVRHIEPMSRLHQELRRARIYRDLPKDAVDAEIRQQLAENPGRIPYLISRSFEDEGTYVITYMIKNRPHHEPVTVNPGGYKWRGKVSPNWHKLIEDFKSRCTQRPSQPKPHGTHAASSYAPLAPAASGAGYSTTAAAYNVATSRFGPAAPVSHVPVPPYGAPYGLPPYGAPMPPRPMPPAYPPAGAWGAYGMAPVPQAMQHGGYMPPQASMYPPQAGSYPPLPPGPPAAPPRSRWDSFGPPRP